MEVAAVDLGASSGRVMLASIGPDHLRLTECHRFPNGAVERPTGLHWDSGALLREITVGLASCAARTRYSAPVAGVGVDAWAVDYGLLGADGRLLGEPFHYRDGRVREAVGRVHAKVDQRELYEVNGLQHLPFTTIYQLAAEPPERLDGSTLLLIPDLVNHWLSGARGAEVTNASTTGLLDVRTRAWSWDTVDALGLPPGLLPALQAPGERVGVITDAVHRETGLPRRTPVLSVASHDTASAVVAVPAEHEHFGYISCGTWGLVGVELPEPVLSSESRQANVTNEAGVDGTVRYLRNVMGLWLLNETMRVWRAQGRPRDLQKLLRQAEQLPGGGPTVDPDDPVFLPPGDMQRRIERECRRTGQRVPRSGAEIVRCILDSLAQAFARTVDEVARLAGRSIEVIHLVGGGANIDLLCRLVARCSGTPVTAGPAEATALGNALVQARALGAGGNSLREMRESVRRTQPLRHYTATGDRAG
ncbi:MAG TPA: rhamnulokinase family protein [Kineosporiaceae bacterium]|nr:rhamnulokinase family protein [Kineosporiaceae bacterium]